MKVHVISLWQPWATLIVSGAKHIETRSWYPRGLRPGETLAIHAAKHWTDEERDLCREDPFFRRYLMLAERRGLWDFDKPPLGGIVGVVTYAGVRRTDGILSEHYSVRFPALNRAIPAHEIAFGNYGAGRWGWLLRDARPMAFVPLRGQQGIFTWDMPEGDAA